MNIIAALCLGIGLSAACGFRVFIPPLALSIAAHGGMLQLSSDWQWLTTQNAIITLSIAATVEVLAYFIPWVSNFLDSIEIGLAPIVGMFITASTLSIAGDFDPTFLWILTVIAGGATAETVELGTSISRLGASVTTAGMGGPIVGFVEAISSIVISILAIALPTLTMLLVIFLIIYGTRRIFKFIAKRKRRRKMKNSLD
ncbi:DUF4126 domain-containing protein [Rivularia sp. UHCC 0363]|uniref:DUF4126 domain-containing protein n=1 Tax=Rivularia sp. UHCC 0363 TaxID=3110244 RepID=UPI002B1FE3E2|nr:DUF4126 domain-containing protein [Rivularia sp. UHCC 0363]MEA5593242.1 DUF4126 domain-containing protein [Rivularia sp. UHCC 0363]